MAHLPEYWRWIIFFFAWIITTVIVYGCYYSFQKKAEKYIDHKIKEAEIKIAKNIVKQYKNLEYNTIADVYMGDSK